MHLRSAQRGTKSRTLTSEFPIGFGNSKLSDVKSKALGSDVVSARKQLVELQLRLLGSKL